MKKIILVGVFIFLKSLIFSQCNEYYINELISGSDEKCYYPSGTPVRFCRKLKGIVINEIPMDVDKWEGDYSPQYLRIVSNGGIAGTVTLGLESKELVINLNGCGSTKYSISLSKSEYDKWLEDAPRREREKFEKQEFEKQEKLKDEKIKNLKQVYNLNNYFKQIDKSVVNEAIKNSQKLRKIIELSNKDTLILEFKNGEFSNMNFTYDLNGYCNYLWDLRNSCSHFSQDKDKCSQYNELSGQGDTINRLSYEICRNEKSAYYGYSGFKFADFFSLSSLYYDTLIENTRIPMNNFRIVIVKNKMQYFNVKSISAPEKFVSSKLYYSKTPFEDKYAWAGYFTNIKTENFIDISQSEIVPINYNNTGKELILKGYKYNYIYVDNIYIGKKLLGEENMFYKFKKIK